MAEGIERPDGEGNLRVELLTGHIKGKARQLLLDDVKAGKVRHGMARYGRRGQRTAFLASVVPKTYAYAVCCTYVMYDVGGAQPLIEDDE